VLVFDMLSFILVFTLLKAIGACHVISNRNHLKKFAILRGYTLFLEVIVAAVVFALLTHQIANKSNSKQGIGKADILAYIYKVGGMIIYVILDLHFNRVIASLANLTKANETKMTFEADQAHKLFGNA
jgi:hypothetical protein